MSIQMWRSPEARFIYEVTPTPFGHGVLPTYDVNGRVIVVARDSKVARKLASALCGDEPRDFWTNTSYTRCQKVGLARGLGGSTARERILAAEFHAG